MKTYKFNVSNPWLVSPTLIFSFLAGMRLAFYFHNLGIFSNNRVISIILSLIFMGFFFIFMVWLIASAEMEVTLEDDIVSVKWIRKFLFNQEQDMKFPFNEIETYVTRSDIHWTFLTINMLNGFDYKFRHLCFISNNFSNFTAAFIFAVNNYCQVIYKKS